MRIDVGGVRAYKAITERIVELELVEKARRGTERRVKQAKLGLFKHIAEFDWNWPDQLNRKRIEKILSCDFVDQKRNAIHAGAQGLEKTILAKNIGHEAAIKGTLFTMASNLVTTVKAPTNQADIIRALKKFVNPEFLILDELGYLSYDCRAADLVF